MTYRTVLVDEVLKETELAFLFDINDDETWVPKSVLESPDDIAEGDQGCDVEIAEWFCRKEGIGD